MGTYRATRHNGRSGKEGVFKAGHNDRTFAVENADHIETSRTCMNVYWDCYQGLNFADKEGNRPERKYNFDQVEQAFYMSKFGDFLREYLQIQDLEICDDNMVEVYYVIKDML